MSGGVDSAVALLEARAAGLEPVGLTLRLWTDPEGPSSERACCSPEAVLAARSTCHALGVPHVTLDRREGFRRAVVAPFVAGYERGETPNPCIRCNGALPVRDVLLVRPPDRRRAARDRALRARALAPRPPSPRARRPTPTRIRPTCSPGSIPACSTGSGSRSASGRRTTCAGRRRLRAWPPPAAPRARRRASWRAADYRDFLARQGLDAARGPDRRREGDGARPPRRLLALHARPAARPGQSPPASPSTPFARCRAPTRSSSARGPSLARTKVDGALRPPLRAGRPREVKLRYRSPATPTRVEPAGRGFRLDARRAGVRRRAGPGGGPLRGRRGRRRRPDRL